MQQNVHVSVMKNGLPGTEVLELKNVHESPRPSTRRVRYLVYRLEYISVMIGKVVDLYALIL